MLIVLYLFFKINLIDIYEMQKNFSIFLISILFALIVALLNQKFEKMGIIIV